MIAHFAPLLSNERTSFAWIFLRIPPIKSSIQGVLSKADIAIKNCVDQNLIRIDSVNGIVYGRSGKEMRGSPNRDGYIRVKLHFANWHNSSSVFLHRIIAYSIWGDELFNWEVNHRDEDKTNNRGTNLELVTHDGNMQHSMNGTKNHKTLLTEKQVLEIRKIYKPHDKNGNSGRDLAKEFDVHFSEISAIILRKIWRHIE